MTFHINPDKIAHLKETFASLDKESLYAEIMAWGKKLGSFNPLSKTEENRVIGCQSLMYLESEFKEGKLYFKADSDALISRGLAALLIYLYSEEEPIVILKCPPTCLEELDLLTSLTPGRANGFASLYLKMQKCALQALLKSNP